MMNVQIKINEKTVLYIKIKNTAKTVRPLGTIYDYQVIDKKKFGSVYGSIVHKTKDGIVRLLYRITRDIVEKSNEH